jgi:hypothetical protein
MLSGFHSFVFVPSAPGKQKKASDISLALALILFILEEKGE